MPVTLFKALADETRIRLLRILLDHELSVNELLTILKMGQSRISRHLRILAEAGLVTSRRDGLWVFYQAHHKGENSAFIDAVTPFLQSCRQAEEDRKETERILLEKSSKTKQFFNSVADNWDNLNQEIIGDFDLAGAVRESRPEDCGLAVDLGCGTGVVLDRMLEGAKGVIGVDTSSRMLDICRKRFGIGDGDSARVSLRIGDLEHLPLRDQEADFASINLVLHHLEKPEMALAEARRILSPRGRLFITDFLRHNDESMRTQFGDRWLGFEESRIAMGLREAGFRRTRIRRQKIGRGLTLLIVVSYAEPPVL